LDSSFRTSFPFSSTPFYFFFSTRKWTRIRIPGPLALTHLPTSDVYRNLPRHRLNATPNPLNVVTLSRSKNPIPSLDVVALARVDPIRNRNSDELIRRPTPLTDARSPLPRQAIAVVVPMTANRSRYVVFRAPMSVDSTAPPRTSCAATRTIPPSSTRARSKFVD
jgi:hypothetical protein